MKMRAVTSNRNFLRKNTTAILLGLTYACRLLPLLNVCRYDELSIGNFLHVNYFLCVIYIIHAATSAYSVVVVIEVVPLRVSHILQQSDWLYSGTSDKGPSEIGTTWTSLQGTKLLPPKCPLFHSHLGTKLSPFYKHMLHVDEGKSHDAAVFFHLILGIVCRNVTFPSNYLLIGYLTARMQIALHCIITSCIIIIIV